jgi:hypothetical protein
MIDNQNELMSVSEYYINYHPTYDYSSLIVGKGGYIPQSYYFQKDYIGYVGKRQFMIKKGYLRQVVDYLLEREPYCCIKIRDERYDEWELYNPKDRRWF